MTECLQNISSLTDSIVQEILSKLDQCFQLSFLNHYPFSCLLYYPHIVWKGFCYSFQFQIIMSSLMNLLVVFFYLQNSQSSFVDCLLARDNYSLS